MFCGKYKFCVKGQHKFHISFFEGLFVIRILSVNNTVLRSVNNTVLSLKIYGTSRQKQTNQGVVHCLQKKNCKTFAGKHSLLKKQQLYRQGTNLFFTCSSFLFCIVLYFQLYLCCNVLICGKQQKLFFAEAADCGCGTFFFGKCIYNG